MIKFITADQTLDLRSSELRAGADKSLCRFDGDDEPGSFHVGYFADETLVSIATFHKQPHARFAGSGFQLRGMATAAGFQGKGIGNQLLNFCIVYLRGQGANYVWCNARQIAYKFYLGLGFEFVSAQFEVPGIGPHKEMYLKIN